MTVVLPVSTSTPNWNLPPPSLGIRTSVMPKTSSVACVTLAWGTSP
jgi:hypothetical protein